jgi:hypothetical protein
MRAWIIAMLAIIAVVAAAWSYRPAPAQDATTVTFDVLWTPENEGQCDKRLPDAPSPDESSPAYFYTLLEVITVRDAAGAIVSMTPLSGSTRGVDTCSVTITADLETGPGHTIWHEDTYLASIPPQGLSGDPDLNEGIPWIVLAD